MWRQLTPSASCNRTFGRRITEQRQAIVIVFQFFKIPKRLYTCDEVKPPLWELDNASFLCIFFPILTPSAIYIRRLLGCLSGTFKKVLDDNKKHSSSRIKSTFIYWTCFKDQNHISSFEV
ncbi:hypothetical protein VNO77_18642 [Canavalia gladiata]|uniref:Uncharacterized protein n=1 Tax=Canavalia gladiata TaxID=3824 RepID=A0AAN9QHV2_CANGL